MGSVKLLNFCIKKKKNFTRCQYVKTICYMFFFSKKSVHYESSTMYQVNRCQEWESKPSLSTKKKKFVNVKPVRFRHSTRSELKEKKKIKAYVETVNHEICYFVWSTLLRISPAFPALFFGSDFGERMGQGFWFYKYCRSLAIFIYMCIYIYRYIYISIEKKIK